MNGVLGDRVKVIGSIDDGEDISIIPHPDLRFDFDNETLEEKVGVLADLGNGTITLNSSEYGVTRGNILYLFMGSIPGAVVPTAYTISGTEEISGRQRGRLKLNDEPVQGQGYKIYREEAHFRVNGYAVKGVITYVAKEDEAQYFRLRDFLNLSVKDESTDRLLESLIVAFPKRGIHNHSKRILKLDNAEVTSTESGEVKNFGTLYLDADQVILAATNAANLPRDTNGSNYWHGTIDLGKESLEIRGLRNTTDLSYNPNIAIINAVVKGMMPGQEETRYRLAVVGRNYAAKVREIKAIPASPNASRLGRIVDRLAGLLQLPSKYN